MLNLLKADLYRMICPTRLHGCLWRWLICILIAALLVNGLIALLPVLISTSSSNPDAAEAVRDLQDIGFSLTTPSAYVANVTIGQNGSTGMLPLFASLGMVTLFFADTKHGLARSIASTKRGRSVYIAEKAMFCGLWSATMLLLTVAAFVVLLCAFGGASLLTGVEPLGRLALWLVCVWLCTWALSVVAMAIAFITRNTLVSYIASIFITSGIIPAILLALGHSGGGVLRVLSPVAPVLIEAANWLPSQGLASLKIGSEALREPAAGALGALSAGVGVQTALVGALWVALASVIILVVSRRKAV